MGLGEEPLTSAAQASAVGDRVTDVYRRRGYVDVSVELLQKAERGRPGRAVLEVRIRPGAQLDVVAIGFPGARHFESTFLEDQVTSYLDEELPGAGLLSPVDAQVADDVTIGPGANHRESPMPAHADPARTFYAPTYEKAVEHIVQLYQADGFLAVQVGPAQVQRASRNRVVVSVPITEGPQTMLYAVTLTGNEALGSQELISESGLRRAMPFSYHALEDARLRVNQLYKERGYLYAKVEPSIRFSQDRTRVEVTIEIVERYQVQVDSVVIKGAERTDEGLIRDLVALRAGDIYRPSIAQQSEERLLALGVFSGVTIAPEDAELPARSKRIEVSVTQRPSQIIDLKTGVSTGQGVRGGLEYGYRDLFGQAIGLTLRAELAYQFFFVQQVIADRYNKLLLQDRLERNVTLSLVIPQLFPGAGVRTSLELFHVRDNQRDFGFDKNGMGIGFTAQPARRMTLTLNGDLENNNINLFINAKSKEALIAMLLATGDRADRTQALQLQRTRVPDGNSFLVAARVSASYDRRDSPFSPTRGYYTSISSELARTLKTESAQINSQFVKFTVTGNGYVSLSKHVVLAVQARAGYIVHLLPHCITHPNTECSQTYPNRSFFMGGIDTVRGYFQDAMVPQDQIATILAASALPTGMPTDVQSRLNANAFVRNGDAFVLYRAELRFPLVGDWYGATFTDLGNLWANPRLINPLQIRTSVGVGVRLVTPVGPLALDYGVVLGARRELGEPTYGTVHFSMGLF
jgi:outer membrane protein assembly complex protein YaeT